MPYTKEERREAVRKAVSAVEDLGDLTFLLTVAMLKTYVGAPSFNTIHAIKMDFVVDPKHNPFIPKLRTLYAHLFTVAEIYTCASLAFDEFSRRVVTAHEMKKIELNGDMKEFEEALQVIAELGKK